MPAIMHRSAAWAHAGARLATFLTLACRRFHAAAGSIACMSPRAARPATPQADAAAEGLVYVHDDQPGLRRHRRGKGFVYTDARGHRITRATELERIRRLAIPPAYVDVWICPNPRGHLQATGRDARGRKQYRYHPRWRQVRDAGKFVHIRAFGKALPRLRRKVRRDLALPGWPREKVLALVVRLLDQTLIRVGNEAYANDNGHYGLTTLRSRHVRPRAGRLRLSFRAKSGKRMELTLSDRRLVRLLRRAQQLPGQRLFQYRDDDGRYRAVDSGMVNDYLRQASGGDFTAKDFRTWAGTVRAIGLLADTPAAASQHARTAAARQVVCEVARMLGNTPAVCRASYIHPRAFEAWEAGRLQHIAGMPPRQLERAVLRCLARIPS
jgi:DNA topoisomerase IB